MPMEETANMLLLLAYMVKMAPFPSLTRYRHLIDRWGTYLASTLPDPENQLCTDDYEGLSAHNANLAAKGIIGLGAYSQLLESFGNHSLARAFRRRAEEFAHYWLEHATAFNHTTLQLDNRTQWSQKYNFLYDTALDLHLFPASVLSTDLQWYEERR